MVPSNGSSGVALHHLHQRFSGARSLIEGGYGSGHSAPVGVMASAETPQDTLPKALQVGSHDLLI